MVKLVSHVVLEWHQTAYSLRCRLYAKYNSNVVWHIFINLLLVNHMFPGFSRLYMFCRYNVGESYHWEINPPQHFISAMQWFLFVSSCNIHENIKDLCTPSNLSEHISAGRMSISHEYANVFRKRKSIFHHSLKYVLHFLACLRFVQILTSQMASLFCQMTGLLSWHLFRHFPYGRYNLLSANLLFCCGLFLFFFNF